MPVTLQSRARRMQVFHLRHDVVCRDHCACEEVTAVTVAENPRTGERARKQLSKKVPGSITFLALEQKPGLPSTLLELAQVKTAIDRGYLRIVEHTPDSAPRVPSGPVPPSPAALTAASALSGSPPAAGVASPPVATTPAATAVVSAPTPPTKAPGKEP
jgi:hypothetical protein